MIYYNLCIMKYAQIDKKITEGNKSVQREVDILIVRWTPIIHKTLCNVITTMLLIRRFKTRMIDQQSKLFFPFNCRS